MAIKGRRVVVVKRRVGGQNEARFLSGRVMGTLTWPPVHMLIMYSHTYAQVTVIEVSCPASMRSRDSV